MYYQELKSANFKSLSLVIALITIGWPQTIKAQYNLQVDSVITEVYVGGPTKTLTVPSGKVWKINVLAAYSSQVSIQIIDSNGNYHWVPKSAWGQTNIRANLHNSGGSNDIGILWLNSGCKIHFITNTGYSGNSYTAIFSALQFSTE